MQKSSVPLGTEGSHIAGGGGSKGVCDVELGGVADRIRSLWLFYRFRFSLSVRGNRLEQQRKMLHIC